MCDCLKNFVEKFKEQYPIWKGRKVLDVNLPEGINFGTGRTFYYLPVYVGIGYKKPKETALILTYCPLCGKSLIEENGEGC